MEMGRVPHTYCIKGQLPFQRTNIERLILSTNIDYDIVDFIKQCLPASHDSYKSIFSSSGVILPYLPKFFFKLS